MVIFYMLNDQEVLTVDMDTKRIMQIEEEVERFINRKRFIALKRGRKLSKEEVIKELRKKYTNYDEFLVAADFAIQLINYQNKEV